MNIIASKQGGGSPANFPMSQLEAFIYHCEAALSRRFDSYRAFERFSVQEYRTFWQLFLSWSGLVYEGDPRIVCTSGDCEFAEFFPDVRLNLVENLLGTGDATKPAITSCAPGREPVRLTRAQLRNKVGRLASSLRELGITEQARVAMVAQSDDAAVVAALGSAALGAIVCMGSTDLAAEANISRLREVQPTVLFCHLKSPFSDTERQLRARAAAILQAVPSVSVVISLDGGDAPDGCKLPFHTLGELVASAPGPPSMWMRYSFNQPYTVLFTSGTTGPPRSVVHGVGGTLLDQLKCHRLHTDIRWGDKIFFHASTAWVIWRIHLSMLAAGAELILNSGPVSSPETLWRIVADEAVTIFGTTPAYLKLCEQSAYVPKDHFDFGSLRSVVAVGSILEITHQDWVKSSVKSVPTRSNYGSTDYASSVLLENPNVPDVPGQVQSCALAVDVRIARQGESGMKPSIGEIVIANPFPSRPLGFLNDPGKVRFHDAYFARNPGFWSQGDLAEFTAQGGAVIHGRADSVINIRGIRIGPGEIYQVMTGIPEITGALAVSQSHPEIPGGERLVLVVTLAGSAALTEQISQRIRDELRTRLSAIYVPDVIIDVPELPITHNGKLSERSASDAVSGRPVANRGAIKNPECLDAIAGHPGLKHAPGASPPSKPHDGPKSIAVVIQEIFARELRRDHIGLEENFFDAGGDSIKAIQILLQIEQALGTKLPITILHQTPTVADLVQLIERQTAPEQSLLIPMKDGAGAPPFFVVHGLGGHVMELRRLLRAVQYPGPIIAIQAQGAAGESRLLTSVDDMAQRYAEAVRAVQPAGPYVLGGYSMGGLIAFEMARRLTADGEVVSPIPMFDTLIDPKFWPAAVWMRMLWSRLGAFFADAGRLRGQGVLHLAAARAASFVEHFIRRYDGDVRRRFAKIYSEPLPPEFKALQEAGIAAVANYRPRYLNQKVFLIKADDGIYKGANPAPIWGRYAQLMSVEAVPGDHESILKPPHYEILATVLSRFLDGISNAEDAKQRSEGV